MKLGLLDSTKNSLSLFKKLQIIIAIVCAFIPVIFGLLDKDLYYIHPPEKGTHNLHAPDRAKGLYLDYNTDCGSSMIELKAYWVCRDQLGFRKTLSNYENSSNSYLFGMMYAIAALLLIYNGVFHYQHYGDLLINNKAHYFYIINGLSLLGVIIFPEYSHSILHNIFSGIFFIGNFASIAFFYHPGESRRSRFLRKLITGLILALLVYLYWAQNVSILYLEWISLLYIAVHLIWSAIKSKLNPAV
jgi:hypothetical protein